MAKKKRTVRRQKMSAPASKTPARRTRELTQTKKAVSLKKVEQLRFDPLTPARWDDLEILFGERGACGGCWCMAWRLSREAFQKGKGTPNRKAFQEVVNSGDPPGVLAFDGDKPVGWCAIAPRQVYVALQRSRVLKPLDDQPVWSVSCFFVRRDWRRSGLGVKLLSAAVEFAGRRGAKIVEGYPVIPYTQSMPAAFAWTGTKKLFEKAGFAVAGAHSKSRPIMRIDTKSSGVKSRNR